MQLWFQKSFSKLPELDFLHSLSPSRISIATELSMVYHKFKSSDLEISLGLLQGSLYFD